MWLCVAFAYPGRLVPFDHPLVSGTLGWFETCKYQAGIPINLGWQGRGLWPGGAMECPAPVYLRRGEVDPLSRLIYAGLQFQPRVDVARRACAGHGTSLISGDLQEAWFPVNFCRLFRDCLLYEDDSVLHLAAGVPRFWHRLSKPIGAANAPTHFGKVSYVMQFDAASRRLTGTVRFPEQSLMKQAHLYVRLPDGWKAVSVNADSGAQVTPMATASVGRRHEACIGSKWSVDNLSHVSGSAVPRIFSRHATARLKYTPSVSRYLLPYAIPYTTDSNARMFICTRSIYRLRKGLVMVSVRLWHVMFLFVLAGASPQTRGCTTAAFPVSVDAQQKAAMGQVVVQTDLASFFPLSQHATVEAVLCRAGTTDIVRRNTLWPGLKATRIGVDMIGLSAGDYDVSVVLRNKNSERVAASAAQRFAWAGPAADTLAAQSNLKMRNSFVIELLHLDAVALNTRQRTFFQPHDGWVFIRSAVQAESGSLDVRLGTVDGDVSLVRHPADRGRSSLESMRYLPKGEHTIRLVPDRQVTLESLDVLAIPELMYISYPDNPHLPESGVYDWAFLERHVLKNLNTIIVEPTSENSAMVPGDFSDRYERGWRVDRPGKALAVSRRGAGVEAEHHG